MQVLDTKLKLNPSKKQEKSNEYFKGTKVETCSHVVITNNIPQAIPYYQKTPLSYADKMQPSSEYISMSHEFHKVRPDMHIGMDKKPLVPYDPNSYRNRLPLEPYKMSVNNASRVVIGNRYEKNDRHYLSVNQNSYGNFGKVFPCSNQGINSANTKWLHERQAR